MRKMKAVLSADSLNQLAHDFKTYVNSIDLKCEKFMERLINEVGIPVIDENIANAKGDSTKDTNTYVEIRRQPNKEIQATLVVENEDILFIEFGAGIVLNRGKPSHPKEKALGYGVGTYPGQTHAFDDDGWWYWNGHKRIHSYGTEATMPVYEAYKAMVDKVERIAKEVFANG